MLLVDDAWKAASHDKDKAAVLADVQMSSIVSNGNVAKSFALLILNFVLHLHHDWSMKNFNIMKELDFLFWIVEGVQTYNMQKTSCLEKIVNLLDGVVRSWQ